MATCEIPLGSAERLAVLYSYPNIKGDTTTLAETIEHWFGLTLQHDGLTEASCSVVNERDNYTLVLTGPAKYATDFATCADRLPQFLAHGWTAWEYDVSRIKAGRAIKPWDPVLNDWRFFLTHGLTLARPMSVQFFHYPPIRLLALRNYLDDPVPHRCEELLVANGVKSVEEARRYEAVMDACPIGASDEQGGLGTIPIDEFYSYQAAQTRMLIQDPQDTTFDEKTGWKKTSTIPIVVYGQHPKRVFSHLFLGERDRIQGLNDKKNYPNGKLDDDTVCVAKNIIPGKSTPVIGSTHPYAFYGTAQSGPWKLPASQKGTIGQGYIHPLYVDGGSDDVAGRMVRDLTIAGWQKSMADKPSQDPFKVLKATRAYWDDKEQWPTVCQYVLHQGSLWYPCLAQGKIPLPEDPPSLVFEWNLSLEEAAKLAKKNSYDLPKCISALYEKGQATAKKAKTAPATVRKKKKAGKRKSSRSGK